MKERRPEDIIRKEGSGYEERRKGERGGRKEERIEGGRKGVIEGGGG